MSGISSVEEKSWFESEGKEKKKKRGSWQEEGKEQQQQLKQKPARMSRMRRFVQTASAIL